MSRTMSWSTPIIRKRSPESSARWRPIRRREKRSLRHCAISMPQAPRYQRLRITGAKERRSMVNSFAALLVDALENSWSALARPNQLPPSSTWWQIWLLLAGRGFGKTRTLAEWVCGQAASGQASRIALVAATAADARDVLVEGESGILAVAPSWCRPVYEPSKRRLTWPNGAIATTFSAEEPERLRGPQHDAAVCDELGCWSHVETWDMLQFGLRLGQNPRCLVATTPRPTKLIRELLASLLTRPFRRAAGAGPLWRRRRSVTQFRGTFQRDGGIFSPGFRLPAAHLPRRC